MRRIVLFILAVITVGNITAKNYMLTPMEALDLVKEEYASNFTKYVLSENAGDYYYKLDQADYYLIYEETNEDNGLYLFRLYEFIADDPDTGIGHTVTYGFYWVDPYTGQIELYK